MIIYQSMLEVDDGFIDNDTKDLLLLLEKLNPSGQKYYRDGSSLAISYRLKIDIFSFLGSIKLKLPVTIIGYPISMDKQGFIGDKDFLFRVLKRINGFSIVLNMDKEIVKGAKTLSTFVFRNKYDSFEQYMDTLRSGYRRRVHEALKKLELLTIEKIDNDDFSIKDYDLYKEVFLRSRYKLELQSMDFFKEFDGEIFQFKNSYNEPMAFVLLKEKDGFLYFIFCGFKNEDIKKYDIYYNMLLFIIREGISRRVSVINFGQTSEETKIKIGCQEVHKYIYIHHNNPIIRRVVIKLLPYFSYRGYNTNHRVFKEII